jgi:hypothetical protein
LLIIFDNVRVLSFYFYFCLLLEIYTKKDKYKEVSSMACYFLNTE